MGGRGSAGGKSSGGGMTKAEEDRRVAELDKTDKYRYHATTERAISGIKEKGLQPSRGQYGEGVYFAKSAESAQAWTGSTSTGGKIVTRVDNRTLVRAGYDEFKGKEEQGWTDKGISSKNIEVRTSNGKWIPISEAAVQYNRGKASIIKKPR